MLRLYDDVVKLLKSIWIFGVYFIKWNSWL